MAVWAPVNSAIQCNAKMTINSKPTEVTFFFRVDGNPILDDQLTNFATAMLNGYFNPAASQGTMASKWLDLCSNTATLNSVSAQPITVNPRPIPVAIYAGAEVGRRAGEVLPPQCAYMFRLRTYGPAKSGQGRRYFPGFSETDQNSGTWNTSAPFTTGLASLGTCIITGVSYTSPSGLPIQLQPIVLSRKLETAYLIFQALGTPTVRTQRRRSGRLAPLVP